MSKLEKWLPFKFFRKSKEDEEGKDSASSTVSDDAAPQGAVVPSAVSPPMLANMMNAFLNDPFFRDPFGSFGELDRWFGDFRPSRFGASTDVVDEESAVRVSMELPGMAPEDIELTVDNGALVVRGEKRNQDERTEHGVFRSERFYGYVNRTIPLPQDVDKEHAEAICKDGVLTIRFPKVDAAKDQPRKIPVS